MTKRKRQKDKLRSIKHYTETKNQATRTPLKTLILKAFYHSSGFNNNNNNTGYRNSQFIHWHDLLVVSQQTSSHSYLTVLQVQLLTIKKTLHD